LHDSNVRVAQRSEDFGLALKTRSRSESAANGGDRILIAIQRFSFGSPETPASIPPSPIWAVMS